MAPDLVVLDLHMPHMDGFQIMESIRPHIPPNEYLPILVITGDRDSLVRERALSVGARDFLNKPFDVSEVLLRIKNLLETRVLHRQIRRHNEVLEDRVRERTLELAETQVEILNRLALAAEYRDDITGHHAQRVGILAELIARRAGLPEPDVELIRHAAPLHDVGKIGIPDAILMKAGTLTPAEYEVIKSHTAIGGKILSGGRFRLLDSARHIALSHHERWDGGGYLAGLKGTDIPVEGRIVAVADVFDSLTHARPYKGASTPEEAIREIEIGVGTQFDPAMVVAFQQVVRDGGLQELSLLGGVEGTAERAPEEISDSSDPTGFKTA